MGCIIDFTDALLKFEFCSQGDKQKILVDVLLKYSEMGITDLTLALGISSKKLHDIRKGKYFLVGEQADDLAQLFLIFFGRTFFRKFSMIRNFY